MADCTHAFCLPYGRGCLFDSAAHTDAHGNLIDTCGHCQFLPTTGEPVRAVQVGCPVHSEHPDARRVRTQVERAADDHTWRHTANGRPGYATWPHTQPGDPSWWRRSLPCGADPVPETEGVGEVTVTLDNSAGRFLPDPGRGLSPVARVLAGLDRPDRWQEPDIHHGPPVRPPHLGPPPLITERESAPPRWWHRLTRRNP